MDAIKDVTRRGEIVLDGFGGSGTTLIAAERTGRVARLIEFDPHYCDVICRRFEAVGGKLARLLETGETFAEVAARRATVGTPRRWRGRVMDDLKPHKAGYMKPPQKNRFKPGQSGNPAGRPKRIDDPYTTLQKVLARRITVTGETKKMTIQEALVRRLRERAIAGDKRAMALQRKILSMAAAALPPVTRGGYHSGQS